MSVKIGYVETATGPLAIVVPAPLYAAWDRVAGAWSIVQLQARYFPQSRGDLPARGCANAGNVCAFPSIEANALVAAGFATIVAGTATQSGVGSN